MRRFFTPLIAFMLGVVLTYVTMTYIVQPNLPIVKAKPEPQIIYKDKIVYRDRVVYKERLTDLEQVVANVKDSCVMIYAYRPDGSAAQGSGWAYNKHIITAKHVIEGANRIEIFEDDAVYAILGEVEYIDDELDLAILKANTTLPSVTLGDSDTLKEGEKVISITSPDGVQNAVDECINSGVTYTDTGMYLVISESSMDGGSSGGAIFNYDSEVIGMVVRGSNGEYYAIPINKIKPILLDKIK